MANIVCGSSPVFRRSTITFMALLLTAAASPLWPQAAQTQGQDDEGLFDQGTLVTTQSQPASPAEAAGESAQTAPPSDILLTSEAVTIGGSFDGKYTSTFSWNVFPGSFEDLGAPDSRVFSDALGTELYFDARPDANFRVYGKVGLYYPFSFVALEDASAYEDNPSIQIKELFADFSWDRKLFFRAGKQSIKTGVGHFFSPADVLSIQPINPMDPTKKREGPVALQINYPFGLDNLYLYVLDTGVTDPAALAISPHAQFIVGTTELTIGGLYQEDHVPRFLLTASYTASDFRFFHESVLTVGTDRTFVRTSSVPGSLETYTDDSTLYYTGTIGFIYSASSPDFTLAVQYLYNGDGYEDPSVIRDNAQAVILLEKSGALSIDDLYLRGLHYLAAAASFKEIGGSNSPWDASLFWIGDISDGSGEILPKLTWNVLDFASYTVSLSLGFPVYYGGTNSEYAPKGDTYAVSIEAHLAKAVF